MLATILLCINVYDTFKALKPAPRASARAATARKRQLKGCLCLWVVWGFWTLLELLGDRTLAWFLPFYGSVKTVFVLFLIFTRTRGSEPIYLHLIRPLLKSHAPSIDSAFLLIDAISSIAIFVFLSPLLALYQYLIRPLGDSLTVLFSRKRSEAASLPNNGHAPRVNGVVPSSREELQSAVQSAHAVYEEIDEAQQRVRDNREMHRDDAQEPRQSKDAEDHNLQLRVRRRRLGQTQDKPRSRSPSPPKRQAPHTRRRAQRESSPPPPYIREPNPPRDLPSRSATPSPPTSPISRITYPPLPWNPPLVSASLSSNVPLFRPDSDSEHDDVDMLTVQDLAPSEDEPMEDIVEHTPQPISRDTGAPSPPNVRRSARRQPYANGNGTHKKRPHGVPLLTDEEEEDDVDEPMAKNKKRRITPDEPDEPLPNPPAPKKKGPLPKSQTTRDLPSQASGNVRMSTRTNGKATNVGRPVRIRDFADDVQLITKPKGVAGKQTSVKEPSAQSGGKKRTTDVIDEEAENVDFGRVSTRTRVIPRELSNEGQRSLSSSVSMRVVSGTGRGRDGVKAVQRGTANKAAAKGRGVTNGDNTTH